MRHLIDAKLCSQHAGQADVHQAGHTGGHFAVAVAQFVQHIVCVLARGHGCDALIGLNAPRCILNITFGDVGVHGDVNEAFRLVRRGRLALFGGNGLVQQLHIHVIAHGLHMAVLALAQQVARAAYLQIAHGNAETGAEAGELSYGGKPL